MRIVILIENDLWASLDESRIDEGIWKPWPGSNLRYRVDPPNPMLNLDRHITIAPAKHIHAKDKQVSWTEHGKRHDSGTFDASFKSIETAKEIAREVLKRPDVVFEEVTNQKLAEMMIEMVVEIEEPSEVVDIQFLRVKS